MVADVRYSCEQVSKPISSYLGGILNGMCFSDHSAGYFVAFPQHIFIDALPPSTKSSAFSKEEEEQEEAWAILLPRHQENLGRRRLPWIFQPPQTRTYRETNSSILATRNTHYFKSAYPTSSHVWAARNMVPVGGSDAKHVDSICMTSVHSLLLLYTTIPFITSISSYSSPNQVDLHAPHCSDSRKRRKTSCRT